MTVVYLIAIVLGVASAIVTPLKIRAAKRARLRAGSFTLAHGEIVTVVGTIRETQELVESPLSARRGVFVYARAELPEVGPQAKLEETRMVPFELDTQHGIVFVDGTGADFTLKPKAPAPRSAERERAFVATHGRGVEVANVATYRELVLEPGMRVAVVGVAQIAEALEDERGYRDPVGTKIRLVRPPNAPITIGQPGDRY